MTKTETVTREFDEEGRVIKETTTTETHDGSMCTLPHYPFVCTRQHYPMWQTSPNVMCSDSSGTAGQLAGANTYLPS